MNDFYKIEDDGIHKLIPADELETYQDQGWKLVMLVSQEQVSEYRKLETDPNYDPNNRYCGPVYDRNNNPIPGGLRERIEDRVCRQTFCLMRKDENSLLGEKKDQIKALNDQVGAYWKERQKLEEENESFKKQYNTLREKFDVLKSKQESGDKARAAVNKTAHKLEKDIAKIRTAIGERQMREILKG